MNKFFFTACITVFAVSCTLGMVMFATAVASEFTNQTASIIVFFTMLAAEIGSLMGWLYMLDRKL